MGMSRFSGTLSGLVLAAAGLAGTPAGAQTAPASPPRLETRISLWSVSGPGGRNDLLRRAGPLGDMASWMRADDPLAVFAGADPGWSGVVSLVLAISPEGRLTACELAPLPPDLPPEAAAGLCDRLGPMIRYRPALTAAGERTEDRARLQIRAARYSAADAAAMPAIRAEPLPPAPPVPMPGPGWPPLVRLKPARLSGGLELLQGGGDAPEATGAPWAGVEVQLNEAGRPSACRIIRSSGDAPFDTQACAAARRATYDLNGATTTSDRLVYLLLTQQDGRLRALPQSRTGRTSPVLDAGAASAMGEAWAGRAWPRVFVSVDARGMPSDCRINESTGDDALDVAACSLIRETARFAPARDSLDRPTAGSVFVAEMPRLR